MSNVESAEEIGELRTLLDKALLVADGLGLEMVALHLSMARDALLTPEPAE